jgi:hypothetical protein
VSAAYCLPRRIFDRTFTHFRECGRGRRECQALWLTSWNSPQTIVEVVHPQHEAHMGGFVLDDGWLNDFWLRLGRDNMGVRIQVHTHPREAFHSSTDFLTPSVQRAPFAQPSLFSGTVLPAKRHPLQQPELRAKTSRGRTSPNILQNLNQLHDLTSLEHPCDAERSPLQQRALRPYAAVEAPPSTKVGTIGVPPRSE